MFARHWYAFTLHNTVVSTKSRIALLTTSHTINQCEDIEMHTQEQVESTQNASNAEHKIKSSEGEFIPYH